MRPKNSLSTNLNNNFQVFRSFFLPAKLREKNINFESTGKVLRQWKQSLNKRIISLSSVWVLNYWTLGYVGTHCFISLIALIDICSAILASLSFPCISEGRVSWWARLSWCTSVFLLLKLIEVKGLRVSISPWKLLSIFSIVGARIKQNRPHPSYCILDIIEGAEASKFFITALQPLSVSESTY